MDLYQAVGLTCADSFETDRLNIRPLSVNDTPALLACLEEPVMRRLLIHCPLKFRAKELEGLVKRTVAAEGRDWTVWADDELIGGLRFEKDFGFWVRKPQQGRGFGFEIAHAALSRWFSHPLASPVRNDTPRKDAAYGRLLSKFGFAPIAGDADKTIITPEQWHALNPWIIETDRLRLMPLTSAHGAEFAAWTGVPEVASMTGSILPNWTASQASEWIEQRRWRGAAGFVMGIWPKDGGAMIGQVGMSKAPTDIGYMIAPAFWGQGYAYEAARGLLDAAFPRLRLDQVVASAFQDNPASMRILDKLGFEKIVEKQVQVPARLEPAMISKYRLTNPDRKPEP